MSEVSVRELRDQTSQVIQRVASAEKIVVTVQGRAVAEIVPLSHHTRHWMSRDEVIQLLQERQADPGLKADLDRLNTEMADEAGGSN